MLCLLLLSTVPAAQATDDSKFSYDGQIRLRSEFDLKAFDVERHAQNFNDLRTRVGLRFDPSDRAFVYVQLQDSRRLGDPESGDLSATNNVDLHQAYFVIKEAIFPWLTVKGGRFEVNYGNQRVFGSVGWNNIGRSWEGGLATITLGDADIDIFNFKRIEMNSTNYNRDFDIIGAYGTIKTAGLDLFAFYEINADSNDYVQEKLKRFNIGGYYSGSHDQVDLTVQGNFQFGEMPAGMLPDTIVLDISAFMATAELGYMFDGRGMVRIAAGIDYSSGDDGSDPTTYKAYDNAYYTGHKFRGYMDYFLDSKPYGLVDIMLRGSGNPAPNWIVKGDIHYFKSAEEYTSLSNGLAKSRNLGLELDLTVINKSISGATITGGFSVFSPDEHFSTSGTDRKAGIWSYFMTVLNF